MLVPFFLSSGIIQSLLEFFILFYWPLALGIHQSIALGLGFDGTNTNVEEQCEHMTGSLSLNVTLSVVVRAACLAQPAITVQYICCVCSLL